MENRPNPKAPTSVDVEVSTSSNGKLLTTLAKEGLWKGYVWFLPRSMQKPALAFCWMKKLRWWSSCCHSFDLPRDSSFMLLKICPIWFESQTNELLVVMVSVVVLRFSWELLPCSLLVLEEMEPVAVIVVTVAVVIVSVIVEVLAVVAVVVVVAVVAVAAAVLVNAVLVVVLWVADVPVVVMLMLAVLMVLVVALVLVVVLVTVLVPLVLLDVVGSLGST